MVQAVYTLFRTIKISTLVNTFYKMATLDDKLLGEKLHYYCSSSEDEGEDKESVEERGPAPPVSADGNGTGPNTGPKGVIKDWQRYKQLEREEREEQDAEKLELAKRLALTCRTDKEDQEAKLMEENLEAEFEVRNVSTLGWIYTAQLIMLVKCHKNENLHKNYRKYINVFRHYWTMTCYKLSSKNECNKR